jgi:iduronate 2-sulfatase
VRTDRYRFVAWFESKTGRIVERELYDHETDPGETRNVAEEPDQAKRVRALESRLREGFGLAKT